MPRSNASPHISVADDVFINCPFDAEYQDLFYALNFTVAALGFRARSALEVDDGGETRVQKILKIIKESRYGIHDISRTELDLTNKLPRFNMPLELGIFFGAKHYGGGQHKDKKLLILDVEKYRYQKFISDIAGMDIHSHENNPETAVGEVRDWLKNVSSRSLISANRTVRLYKNFVRDLPAICSANHFEPAKISYADFQNIVATWLNTASLR